MDGEAQTWVSPFRFMAKKKNAGIDTKEAPAGSWGVPEKIDPSYFEDKDYCYQYGEQKPGIPDEVDD